MCFKCGLDYEVAVKTEHRMPLLVLFRHGDNFKEFYTFLSSLYHTRVCGVYILAVPFNSTFLLRNFGWVCSILICMPHQRGYTARCLSLPVPRSHDVTQAHSYCFSFVAI